MKSLRNSVSLIGHLGQNPEIKNFKNGNKKATFVLATSDSYKNKAGEKVEETQWHKIVAYGLQVEIIEQYLTKGRQISLEGKLCYKIWETKKGEKRFTTEIELNNFLMLDTSSSTSKKSN